MNNDLILNMKIASSDNINMKLEDNKPINANMSGGIVEIDPIFTESPAYTITYNDINYWNNKSNFSGNYNDLTNKPKIPTQVSDLINDLGYITKTVNNLENYTLSSNLSEVATSGSYTDLLNKPTIPTDTSDLTNNAGFITNTVNDLTNYTLSTNLASVATTGSYTDLSNTPTLATVATSGLYQDLLNKPTLSTVASTGDYDDLIDKPTIPTDTSDLTNNAGFITNTVNDLTNYTLSSNLATVATSGSYTDLTNKPTIPTKTSDLQNDSGFITTANIPTKTSDLQNDSGFITNSVNDLTNYTLSSNLATVATTGSYTDLTNKPTIPDTPTTIYTGTLKGTDYTTLSGVKNKLIIYAQGNGGNMVYTLDIYYATNNRASGMCQCYDGSSGRTFYTSECNYDVETGKFTHTRTGYIDIANGTFNARNSNSGYFIYKIETI